MRRSPVLGALLLALAALLLAPRLAAAASYTNSEPITIPTAGEATPTPSAITVDGVRAPISRVVVTLHKFGHTNPEDVDVLLVAPNGKKVVLMSDACGADDITDYTWTFDSTAATPIPRTSSCDDFIYAPANYPGDADSWPSAPAGDTASSLAYVRGDDPNGAWRLYVSDDHSLHGGEIKGGWSLGIDTSPVDAAVPATGTEGPASSYPAIQTVSGRTGVVREVEIGIEGLSHERPEDLDVLLVGPRGQKVLLMADACGATPLLNATWTWGETGETMAGSGSCDGQGRRFKPTGNNAGASLPAPAPPGPYATSLSALNFADPNGEWKLYVHDDAAGAIGWILRPFAVAITTRAPATVRFPDPALSLPEGGAGLVTLERTGNPPYGPATIAVLSEAGSAASGEDFIPVSSTVRFAAGETRKSVPVAVLTDGQAEPDESFALTLADPTGDAALPTSPDDPSRVTVTIPGQPAPDPPPGTGSPTDPVDPPPADRAGPVVTVTPGSRVARDGTVKARVRCSEACAGRVTLASGKPLRTTRSSAPRRLTLGSAPLRLAARGSVTVKVRLTATARKALRLARRIRVTTTVTVADTAGNAGIGRAKGTLR